MKSMSFTPQELYCMALIQNKTAMYGIPDRMGGSPQEKADEIIDAMLTHHLAQMDLDGNLSLTEPYAELVEHYCECGKCLTVTLQEPGRDTQSLIFWERSGRYLIAQCIYDRYVFTEVREDLLRALPEQIVPGGYCLRECPEAVIPNSQLQQAKRACARDDIADAVRLLRQNGAVETAALAIADGLRENACSVDLVLMDMTGGDCRKTEVGFLAAGNEMLALSSAVVNYRSCTVFTPSDTRQMRQAAAQLVARFLEKGDS